MGAAGVTSDRQWYITARWQQYEGESRANLLRILAVGVLYLIHLWSYFSSRGVLTSLGPLEIAEHGSVPRQFHLMVTLLALAWALSAAVVHTCLINHTFPSWISAASTVVDLLLLTCLLCIASGPTSPLVTGYFVIIALASLRISLPLVRLTTVGAVVGYLCVLGCAKWPEVFGRDPRVLATAPRYHQLIVIAALTITGVVVGQTIRRFRIVAETQSQFATDARQETN